MYIFFIDLESIQHKLSSDYSLNICFSRCFPYIDGPKFSPYKPLQNVNFWKVGIMQLFSGIVLTYWQELREKVWGYVSRRNSKQWNLFNSHSVFIFFYVFSAVSCPSSCYRRLTFGDRMKKFKDDLICLEKTSIFQITVISSPQKLTSAGKYLETYDTRLILIIKCRYRNRLISSYPVAFCFNKESAFDSGKDLD